MSGLKLTGSLSVTKSALSNVGSTMDVSMVYGVETSIRNTVTTGQAYTYYIQTDYNLNSLVSFNAGPSSPDDAYGFATVTINDVSAVNPVLAFPANSGVIVGAGTISAKQEGNPSPLGTFSVTLTMGCNSSGVLSASIAVAGESVAANVDDNNLLAQVAYWPILNYRPPEVGPNTTDNLIEQLTLADVQATYATALSNITSMYHNVNLLTAWSITLAAITMHSSNQIANFARAGGATGATVFAVGDKVVAETPFSYTITVLNNAGNPVIIVPEQNVFGVIRHA